MRGSMSRRILVAPAWPYANGPRHVGHVAGFAVPADIFARYHRLAGNEVLMVSGTDEHGTPMTVAADREGISPKELADRNSALIRADLRDLGMAYDWFTRTTTASHAEVSQRLFLKLLENERVFRDTTQGAFSQSTGNTLPDRYIEGTCPVCGYESARGDQCDNCGSQLDPVDLIEPRSIIDGAPPVFRDTEHFFLDLPSFADALKEWIGRQQWRPNVQALAMSLADDLKPRAITRDMEWGVPIPLPEYDERRDKVLYVWFDAVIGYLSAAVEWARARGDDDAWRRWWTDPDAQTDYFMGKDNIVFHTIIWPAILMGSTEPDASYNLPSNVVASEYLTMEGRKFSSSRGVIIYVRDMLESFQADALRYYLTVGGPETQDTDFTLEEFARRTNGELVAKWGNLVQRAITLTQRNFGAIPEPGEPDDAARALTEEVQAGFGSVAELIERHRLQQATREIMRMVDLVNVYFSSEEPWKLVKEDQERAAAVLHTVLQCISDLGVMFAPLLPFSSQQLHEMLGFAGLVTDRPQEVTGPEGQGVLSRVDEPLAATWGPRPIRPGQPLEPPAGLFRRITPEEVAAQTERLGAAAG